MLRKWKRGNWWHIEGKNSCGVLIKRHSTERSSKEAAQKYLLWIDTATEWPPKPPAPPVEEVPFALALEKYLRYIWPKTKQATRDHYQYDLEHYMFRLLAEVKPVPVLNVSQLRHDHLVDLQHHWLTTQAVGSALGHRRCSNAFLRFCVKPSGWLTANPWDDIPKPETNHIATLPLDEDKQHANWNRIRSSIVPFLKGELLMPNGKPFLRPSNPLWQHPENFLGLLELMYDTGLRRSDAIMFDPRQMKLTELGNWAYKTDQQKSRLNKEKPVTVFLEPWLAQKLRALPVLDELGLPFFKGGLTHAKKAATTYVTHYVSTPLALLGETLGIPDLRCHRFRDSFAVNFLASGGSLEDLKVLLGHSKISVTEFYYNPWVKEREEALEKNLQRARARQNPATRLTVVPAA
jgi:integrase